MKFKYPRQRKTVVADGIGQGYKEVQEISPNLRYVIDELDQICQRDRSELDLKRKILDDLRHRKASSRIRSVKSKPIWTSLPVSKLCVAGWRRVTPYPAYRYIPVGLISVAPPGLTLFIQL